jgi:hypothetical protein
MPKRKPTRTTAEGRVNIPLGKAKQELAALATANATTESNLARVLLLDGIERLKTGVAQFSGPKLEEVAR